MLYFRAQRILSLGRSSFTFYMLNVHISRQALHLVILLNDLAYMEDGLNSEQMDERVDLEEYVHSGYLVTAKPKLANLLNLNRK